MAAKPMMIAITTSSSMIVNAALVSQMTNDGSRTKGCPDNGAAFPACLRHCSFVISEIYDSRSGLICRPLMMLMSGMNKAMTIVPTINARNTIMIGSSIEVRPATELSTSSS